VKVGCRQELVGESAVFSFHQAEKIWCGSSASVKYVHRGQSLVSRGSNGRWFRSYYIFDRKKKSV